MNKLRRKDIDDIIAEAEMLKEKIQAVYDEEEEYRDNIPENMQMSERYENADNACNSLDEAISNLDDAISNLSDAQGN